MTASVITPRSSTVYPERMLARFRFGAPAELRPCRFIDVWENGAALELYAVDECEPLAGLIALEGIVVTGAFDGGPMHGVVSHRLRTELGRVIVCIAFRLLSYEQRLEVEELIGLRGLH